MKQVRRIDVLILELLPKGVNSAIFIFVIVFILRHRARIFLFDLEDFKYTSMHCECSLDIKATYTDL